MRLSPLQVRLLAMTCLIIGCVCLSPLAHRLLRQEMIQFLQNNSLNVQWSQTQWSLSGVCLKDVKVHLDKGEIRVKSPNVCVYISPRLSWPPFHVGEIELKKSKVWVDVPQTFDLLNQLLAEKTMSEEQSHTKEKSKSIENNKHKERRRGPLHVFWRALNHLNDLSISTEQSVIKFYSNTRSILELRLDGVISSHGGQGSGSISMSDKNNMLELKWMLTSQSLQVTPKSPPIWWKKLNNMGVGLQRLMITPDQVVLKNLSLMIDQTLRFTSNVHLDLMQRQLTVSKGLILIPEQESRGGLNEGSDQGTYKIANKSNKTVANKPNKTVANKPNKTVANKPNKTVTNKPNKTVANKPDNVKESELQLMKQQLGTLMTLMKDLFRIQSTHSIKNQTLQMIISQVKSVNDKLRINLSSIHPPSSSTPSSAHSQRSGMRLEGLSSSLSAPSRLSKVKLLDMYVYLRPQQEFTLIPYQITPPPSKPLLSITQASYEEIITPKNMGESKASESKVSVVIDLDPPQFTADHHSHKSTLHTSSHRSSAHSSSPLSAHLFKVQWSTQSGLNISFKDLSIQKCVRLLTRSNSINGALRSINGVLSGSLSWRSLRSSAQHSPSKSEPQSKGEFTLHLSKGTLGAPLFSPSIHHINGKIQGVVSQTDRRWEIKDLKLQRGLVSAQGHASLSFKPKTSLFKLTLKANRSSCQDAYQEIPRTLLGPIKNAKLKGDFQPRLQLTVQGGKDVKERVKFKLSKFLKQCTLEQLKLNIRPIPQVKVQNRRADLNDVNWLNEPFTFQVSPSLTSGARVIIGPGTRHYIRLKELPSYVGGAMYLTEEMGFWRGGAISPTLIQRAINTNLEGGRFIYGGSTITQQLVKNLFLSREKSLQRKIQEALISARVIDAVSKNRILELYLNCIEFAPKVFGIYAASQYYFQKDPRALSPQEAVFLSMLKVAPWRGPRWIKRGHSPTFTWWKQRSVDVFQRLVKRGLITQRQSKDKAPFILQWSKGKYLGARSLSEKDL